MRNPRAIACPEVPLHLWFAGKQHEVTFVAVGIDFLGKSGGNGFTFFVGNAFGYGDHAAAVAFIHGLHIGRECFDGKGTLGQVDQMGAVAGVGAGKRGCCGQEACMASHYNIYFYTAKRTAIQIVAHEGAGDEARGTGKARSVVVFAQIVIDGFGNVEAAQG
jgi:hypothetical protein